MEKKVIVGDFSGIQGYLYNIQRNKSATKRLKGRSTFIEILLEKIKDDLIETLGNCEDYLISGGKFIIISNDFDENKLEAFKKDLEEKLLKQFYGELKITFGVSESYDENNFKESINNAFENLEKNKNKAFSSVFIEDGKWNSNKFVFSDDRGPDSVCKFSRGDLIIDNINDTYVNNIIEEEKLNGIGQNTANDIIISNYIAGKKGGNTKIKIFNNDEEIKNKYKKYLPKDEQNNIKTFELLAGNSNKLACLKGDIDDLGKLFMFGLKTDNYKENYSKLSEKLDDFWNEKLYKLIGEKDIYVVYAGGDDFLILGNWIEIIDFYEVLKKAFFNFQKSNEVQDLLIEKQEIHFSGSIKLFLEHDTFFTVVKQTEELLSEAKTGDKNNINIFGKVISNDDFTKIFKEIKGFEEKYSIFDKEKSIISVGTLRFLLGISKKIIIDKADGKDEEGNTIEFFEYGLWRAELFYHLARNYKTKSGNDISDEFRKYIDGMLLHNEIKVFDSLSGNNDLFGAKVNKEDGEKLFVMMSYILYRIRS